MTCRRCRYLWFHVVTAGCLVRVAAASRSAAAGRPRARGARSTATVLRSEPGAPRPASSTSSAKRSATLRDPAPRRRRRAHASLRRGPARPSGRAPAGRGAAAVVHVAAGHARGEWMQGTLRLMAAEARELRPGGEAVITRLARHLVDPGDPRLARAATRPRDAAGSGALRDRADRPRARPDPPRPGAGLDGRRAGRRARDVALGVRRPLHRARRRAGWLRRPAGGCTSPTSAARGDATVAELADRLGYHRRPLQPRLQANHRLMLRVRRRSARLGGVLVRVSARRPAERRLGGAAGRAAAASRRRTGRERASPSAVRQ